MKIYTRTGDRGETGLADGSRVAKDAAQLETCGTVDELSAVLGLVRAAPLPEEIDRLLEQVQHDLCRVGAELATVQTHAIGPQHVKATEEAIDRYQAELEPLGEFILPAGSRAGAGLHLARTVCRRAERRLATLARSGRQQISPHLTAYLNRLADLLFVLARVANARAGQTEVRWRKNEQ